MTQLNLTEQMLTPAIVVDPKVRLHCDYYFQFLTIDARPIDSRAGYIKMDLDDYSLIAMNNGEHRLCVPSFALHYDPNRPYNWNHIDNTFLPEFADAEELVKQNKEHILIFDNCLMHCELIYKPEYRVYVMDEFYRKENMKGLYPPSIVVNPNVTLEFDDWNPNESYLTIDARPIDSRAGYVNMRLTGYCLLTGDYEYSTCISVYDLFFDPKEYYDYDSATDTYYSHDIITGERYRITDIPHIDNTFLPEFAEAEELVKQNKEHTLIFDNCLMHCEFIYKPEHEIYVIE